MTIYNFKVEDKKGNSLDLNEYKGKVLLIINSATGCGFTPQYEALESLYKELNNKGFEILDFPCNQFGNQAPGSDEEITTFCKSKYDVTFPQFRKLDVNGENESLLFKHLKEKTVFSGFDLTNPLGNILDEMLSKMNPNYKDSKDIKWNFTKFLVNRNGEVIKRFEPTDSMELVEREIKNIL